MIIFKERIFIAFYTCIIITCITTETPIQSKPKLELTQDWPDADWKLLNLSDGSLALFSPAKHTFILNCTAAYPIQWKIQGQIEPSEFVIVQPYRRITGNSSDLFIAKIIIFFTDTETTFSSAKITCEKVGDPQLASVYGVFVPSDNTLLAGNIANLPQFNSKFMIPCPTTNPTAKVTLHRLNLDGKLLPVQDESLTYSPTEGFQSSNPFGSGTFVCLAVAENGVESRVNFTIPKCNLQQTDNDIISGNKSSPPYSCLTWNVKAFLGEPLEVFCPTPNYTIIWENKTEGVQIQNNSSGSFPSYKIQIPTQSRAKGIVKCGTNTENWNFEVLGPAPELYLDNYEGEIDCLSEYPDRSVSTVRCRDPSSCQYMKHCLSNNGGHKSSCNFRRLKHFHSEYPARCWVQKRNEGASCASMPFYHLNGMVACRGGGGVKYFMFFIGLDYHRYSNWKEAPTNALIRLEAENSNGNGTEFLCEAAAFIFADSLKFSVKYANGTETFLDSSTSSEVSNPQLHDHPRRMDERNVVGVLVKRVPFPAEVIYLRCHAPFWNSTNFLMTEMKLNK